MNIKGFHLLITVDLHLFTDCFCRAYLKIYSVEKMQLGNLNYLGPMLPDTAFAADWLRVEM